MEYNKLEFVEIGENQSQAVVKIGSGYRIQIIRDDISGNSECNLYTPQGEILDSVDNEDGKGVEFFISESIKLMDDIEFWETAIGDQVVLIEDSKISAD